MIVVFCKHLRDHGYLDEAGHRQLNSLLRWCLKNHFFKPMGEFYISDGQELTRRMVAGEVDWSELAGPCQQVLALIKEDRLPEAALAYIDMIVLNMDRHWPDCRNPFYTHAKRVAAEAKVRLAEGRPLVGVVPDACHAKTLPDL